ncbi:hypothetical protein DPMN_029292 [Dreissena polymorpha]|uniref:Uncharacterized protein n=1 Tax=Dreissena polymorpha TaxID=45954 RepID=A0A9D4RG40_DREPO|nr:hypothetical protein DPMN_029292 [Dreissena polymorpha]
MVDIERQWEAITETSFNTLPVDEQLYILINSWPTLKTLLKTHLSTVFHEFEKHCGRLLYGLDRTRQLLLVTNASQRPPRTKHTQKLKKGIIIPCQRRSDIVLALSGCPSVRPAGTFVSGAISLKCFGGCH